ncbi:MAG: metal-dependent hydrolase [Candidatus Kryptoniota bacterium]
MDIKTSKKTKIQWFGHSAFRIIAPNDQSILIDPWLDNPLAPKGIKEAISADVILLTHGHFDHIGNTVEIAWHSEAKVISNFEISLYLKNKGLKEENLIGMNKSGTFELNGIAYTMVNAEHSSAITDGEKVINGGSPGGFVIKFTNGSGPTIYHSGDTGVFGDMKLIGELYSPEVALLCIGGHFTMGPREAAKAVELLRPKKIIPMHYGTFPILKGSPEELKKLIPDNFPVSVVQMKPGDIVEL